MKILMVGSQGSGKSTQADLLANFLGVPKISTGDIFRQLKQEDSDEGRRIKQILDSGQLMDDATTAEIVKKKVSEEALKNGFIMDGYPRTLEQLNMFDPGFDKVIYLKVADEEVIKRLLGRGREDDTKELIKTRLDLYNQHTQPILDYYRQQGILREIDGTGEIQRIQDEIKKQI